LTVFHPILRRQLRKLGLRPEEAPAPEAWGHFLERVHGSYLSADLDRYTLERSLSLSSEEMRELTQRLQMALEYLDRLSMTDELTGLMNRRFLNITIHEEVSKVIRNYRHLQLNHVDRILANVDLAFVMVDIDHFKGVNDTYGHAAGDQVLVQVCQLLSTVCRGTDTVIRWGGEEFLVVARNLSRQDLGVLCERVRQEMAQHSFLIGPRTPLHLTCSLGAAVFPFLDDTPNAIPWHRVVEIADTCLYAAKRSGRNAWVWVSSTELTTPKDLEHEALQDIPTLIRAGRLECQTSLREGMGIEWV